MRGFLADGVRCRIARRSRDSGRAFGLLCRMLDTALRVTPFFKLIPDGFLYFYAKIQQKMQAKQKRFISKL
jgi:hypothetical protein